MGLRQFNQGTYQPNIKTVFSPDFHGDLKLYNTIMGSGVLKVAKLQHNLGLLVWSRVEVASQTLVLTLDCTPPYTLGLKCRVRLLVRSSSCSLILAVINITKNNSDTVCCSVAVLENGIVPNYHCYTLN